MLGLGKKVCRQGVGKVTPSHPPTLPPVHSTSLAALCKHTLLALHVVYSTFQVLSTWQLVLHTICSSTALVVGSHSLVTAPRRRC